MRSIAGGFSSGFMRHDLDLALVPGAQVHDLGLAGARLRPVREGDGLAAGVLGAGLAGGVELGLAQGSDLPEQLGERPLEVHQALVDAEHLVGADALRAVGALKLLRPFPPALVAAVVDPAPGAAAVGGDALGRQQPTAATFGHGHLAVREAPPTLLQRVFKACEEARLDGLAGLTQAPGTDRWAQLVRAILGYKRAGCQDAMALRSFSRPRRR